MTWVFLVWTLAAGGVDVKAFTEPTLERCVARRAEVSWRLPGRAEGTGTLVGACRPSFARGQNLA